MGDQVWLRCVRQGGRLRVRIISPGYLGTANCQFPRAIRQEGRSYTVPPSSIRLSESKNGRFFYRVSQPIRIAGEEDEAATAEQPPVTGRGKTKATTAKPSATKRKRAAAVEKPIKVFDVEDEPECVVCLEATKERICVPCGHYCLCESCFGHLVQPKKCPLCRTPIRLTISPSDL